MKKEKGFDFGRMVFGCAIVAFGAKVKMKSIRRAFTFAYPLPSPVV